MKLSIVTTLYNSAPYIQEFTERISKTAEKITKDYEIIFVNDGSPDNSLDIALELYRKNKHINIIDLSRNFGHHKAFMTGLKHTRGERVFLIDVDLEEQPELLKKFIKELNEDKSLDMIFGIQKTRTGEIGRIIEGLFYYIFNIISPVKIAKNLTNTRLMTRRYVKTLVNYSEEDIFFPGLCTLAGFKQKAIKINKFYKGSSSYTFIKKINIFFNSVTSFSEMPLIYISFIGFFILFLSIIYILYLLYNRLLLGKLLEGWISLIISVWFLGGLIIFFIGIIGMYLAKIFKQVKQRPYVNIKQIYFRHRV